MCDVHSGDGCVYVGVGDRNFLSAQFFCLLETALKIKYVKNCMELNIYKIEKLGKSEYGG